MATKISAVMGWLGTALVVVALALRFLKPEWDQYRSYTAYAGLVCILVYLAAQWRESQQGHSARQAKLGALSVVSVIAVLALLAGLNYIGVRQNKRWDLTANQVFSLSEQTLKVLQGLDSPAKLTVFDQAAQLRSLPRSARGVHLPGQEPVGGLRRHRPPAGARQGRQRADRGHDGARVQGPRRTHHQPRRAGHRQRVHQGDHRPGAQGLLHRRPRREGSGQHRSHRLQLDGPGADQRQLRQREAGAGAEADRARRRDDGGRGRSAHRLLPAGSRGAQDLPGQGRQAPGDARSARQAWRGAAHQPDRARQRVGHPGRRRRGRRRVGRRPDVRRRRVGAGGRQLPGPSDHRELQPADRLPDGALGDGSGRGRQRPHRAGLRRDEPAELGREGSRRPDRRRPGDARRRQGRQAGPGRARRGGIGGRDRRPGPAGPGRRPGDTAGDGDTRGRRRRFRLRRQLRPRHPGQP